MKIYISFPQGRSKALTMSYDDGKVTDERLVEIFNKNGIKGSFNLNYGIIDEEERTGKFFSKYPRIKRDQVRTLYAGHEVATHTSFHPTVARCPMLQVTDELLSDKTGLEQLSGYVIRGHAYPNGSYSEEIKTLLRTLGFAYARVVEATGEFELPRDYMEWKPTCHHNDERLMELARFFAEYNKHQYLKLMYVWGHSYEFEDRDNWQVIEEFCSYMGGRDDIWYATNIEIADYMDAASRLRYSGDCTMVENPAAMSVWVTIDDKRHVEIPGGATVSLKQG